LVFFESEVFGDSNGEAWVRLVGHEIVYVACFEIAAFHKFRSRFPHVLVVCGVAGKSSSVHRVRFAVSPPKVRGV